MRNPLGFFLIWLILSAASCNTSDSTRAPSTPKEQLLRANQGMVARESERIEGYLRRRGYKARSTGSGLRFVSVKEGQNTDVRLPVPEDVVSIEYSISLLDGTLCYASQTGKPATFRVEHDVVESGLHEGIQLMKAGSEAILIMPPHLAHGLVGDEQKIPPMSTLVMQVKLIEIKSRQQ